LSTLPASLEIELKTTHLTILFPIGRPFNMPLVSFGFCKIQPLAENSQNPQRTQKGGTTMKNKDVLRKELLALLRHGNAHMTFEEVVHNLLIWEETSEQS
jgi:hypothetical protein